MKKERTVHKVFKIITILKGIHAILVILTGIILLIISKELISNIIIFLVKTGFVGDPSSSIAQYISQFGINFSSNIKLFISLYLIGHGVVGLSLVYGIIKKPSLAYPISLVIFIGFIIYQIYDYFILPTMLLLLFTLFDILFVGLLFYEYNHLLKEYTFLGKLKLIAKAKVPKIIEIEIPKISIIKLNKSGQTLTP